MVILDESGPAPPQVCWERYAVPATWPTWAPQIHSVELDEIPTGRRTRTGRVGAGATAVLAGERIVPGLRGRVRGAFPPAARFVITAVDELERTWSWRVGVGPVRLELDHGVDACLDGGTAAWVRISGPAPVIRMYAPMARAALRHLVR